MIRWCCGMHKDALLVFTILLTNRHGYHRLTTAITAVDAVVLNNNHHRLGDKSSSTLFSTVSHNSRTNHRHRGIIDDASLHPIGLIEEWIATIKEETRLDEEEWRMNMNTGDQKSTMHDEDDRVEWDAMMAEKDEELYKEKELEDEDDEWEEFQPSSNRTTAAASSTVLSHRRRKMQASGGCVQTADGLQSAVRGSSPSQSTRITVCTQRMKLGSTARRRRLQKQPTVSGVTGGGINFSNRQIMLRCKYIRKKCILDGEEVSRIFYGTNVTLYLIGFQFSNATAHDKFASGSALSFLDNSVITIKDCSFLENKAKRGGGAVLLQDSKLNFRNSRTSRTNFVNNQAQFGGAIYSINSTIETIVSDQPKLISLSDNQARDDGGAIYMVGGSVVLSNFLMNNNAGNNGGAGVFIGVDVNLSNVDVSYNTANTTGGGLVFIDSTIYAENLNVTNNRAGGVAGGMYFNNSDIHLSYIFVQNNTADFIGGMQLVSSNGTIFRGDFEFNNATYDGGAVAIKKSSNVTFVGSVFLNNTGGSTGENDYSVTNDSAVEFLTLCFTSNAELRNAVLIYNLPSTIQTYSNVEDWCVGLVTDFSAIFQSTAFNEDVSKWDTSNATSMYATFSYAHFFNQNISKWDVSKVTVMHEMFHDAYSFNQDISKWDVSKVTDMFAMFLSAYSFNKDISKWDVSYVQDMTRMFEGATSFNQDISGWNISQVGSISSMFNSATSFNQNLCSWNATCHATVVLNAFAGTSCPNTTSDPVCGSGPFCFNCP